MKAELTRVCAALLGLVVCAAAQDLSPTVLGAKPPFLLVFGCFAGIPAAIGAGLFADALGGLPFGCSAVFYAVATLAARLAKSISIAVTILAAVTYQIWITLWSDGERSVWTLAGALAATSILAPAMLMFIRLVRRRIGLDIRKETR